MEQLKNLKKFSLKLPHGADGHIIDWLFITVNIPFEKFDESNDINQSSDFCIMEMVVFED